VTQLRQHKTKTINTKNGHIAIQIPIVNNCHYSGLDA
jgi:hypothetical protein